MELFLRVRRCAGFALRSALGLGYSQRFFRRRARIPPNPSPTSVSVAGSGNHNPAVSAKETGDRTSSFDIKFLGVVFDQNSGLNWCADRLIANRIVEVNVR